MRILRNNLLVGLLVVIAAIGITIILVRSINQLLRSLAAKAIADPVSNRELVSRVNSMARLIRAERKTDRYILELEQAMENIKVLSGIIPICMHCKKIRDDKGYWNQLEVFIQSHSSAQFSHGLCEACLEKYYPEEDEDL